MCAAGPVTYASVAQARREYALRFFWIRVAVLKGFLNLIEAGYKALFLSVDVPVLGKRLNEYRNNYQLPEDMEWPNILSNGGDTSNRTEYGE